MSKEQLVIEQIHAAFDGAQDLLHKEAEETLKANLVPDTDKIKELVELGFVNAKGVQEANDKMKLAIESKQLAIIVLYYKENYPFLKFLTEEKLNEICDKYNLIHAPVANYIEDVPEKNMKEIAGAQRLMDEDAADDIVTPWASDDTDTFGRPTRTGTTTTDRQGLFIAAPESHFDLKDLTKKGVRGFFKTVIEQKVDDPIVFRYVNGGIQVLSKWGLEASDPELTNALDN